MSIYRPTNPRHRTDPRTAHESWVALLNATAGSVTPCLRGDEWTSDRPAEQARAIQLCQGCAILAGCRRHALAVLQPAGVWGGTTPAERAALSARQSA